jgi:hypothetical protein
VDATSISFLAVLGALWGWAPSSFIGMGVARREEHRAAAAAFLYALTVLGVLAGGAGVRAFEDGTAVYIVTMKQAPVSHRRLNLEKFGSSKAATAVGRGGSGEGGGGDTPTTSVLRKPRLFFVELY